MTTNLSDQITEVAESKSTKALLWKLVARYRHYLNTEELKQAKYIAVWKASKYLGNKQTTSIYNHFRWECIRILKEKKPL